jgi:hypothetical protein
MWDDAIALTKAIAKHEEGAGKALGGIESGIHREVRDQVD